MSAFEPSAVILDAVSGNLTLPSIGPTPGDDVLVGSSRDDRIKAQAGDDEISGKGGNDIFIGDRGVDEINRGKGVTGSLDAAEATI
ncbi:MAG: hypothetical protein AB3N13_06695 [Arenibacterium sp.]